MIRRYTFRQNNSGGYYVGPHYFVCLALDEDNAWNILKSQDWYTDKYCRCCGPRWETSWDWESDPASANEALQYLDYRDSVIDLTQENVNG